MISGYCVNLVLPLSAYLWALVLHEAGHYFYFRWVLHKKVVISLGDVAGSGCRLTVGCPRDYKDYSATQKLGIYLAGIAAGAIPLILYTWYAGPADLFLLACYVYGCGPDIKNITRLHK